MQHSLGRMVGPPSLMSFYYARCVDFLVEHRVKRHVDHLVEHCVERHVDHLVAS